MERIILAREYQVEEWLLDAFLELITQKTPLDFEKLQPTESFSNPLDRNWEVYAKKLEVISRDWETLARISNLQMKVATSIVSFCGGRYYCYKCCMNYGGSPSDGCLCKCRLLAMVDEAFRGELESYPGHVEHPFPRKLPISYLCLLKKIIIV